MTSCVRFLALIGLFLLPYSSIVSAQTLGTIAGRLTDTKTGEGLVGATVIVVGSQSGAAADIDGKFSFKVSPGTYSIEVRSIGYITKRIDRVNVVSNQVQFVEVSLTSTDFEVKEVEIVANVARNNDNSLLRDQRSANGVSSGVTAELLAKTPDRSISESFKRVSGASVRDGKFPVVRGLQERYNQGQVNGMSQPSTEADRKAFSLDLFPTALVDKIVVYKTATPDLPGDFAGGVILINTVDIPFSNVFTISASTEYNSITTNKTYLQSVTSRTDFLGFDDGTRALPKGIYSAEQANKDIGYQTEARQARLQNNNFGALSQGKASPNIYFQAFLGRRGTLFGKNAGLILGVNYYRTFKYTDFLNYIINTEVYDSASGKNKVVDYDSLRQNRYTTTSSLSATANFSIRPDAQSKLAFRNLLVTTGSDLYIQGRTSSRSGTGQQYENRKSFITFYDENRLSTHQLTYERALGTEGAKVDVLVGASYLDRTTPDFKRLTYFSSGNVSDTTRSKFRAAILQVPGPFNPNFAGKFYSTLNEESYNGLVNGSMPVSVGSLKNTVKAGANYQWRSREYQGRNFNYGLGDKGPATVYLNELQFQGPDSIFRDENMGGGLANINESTTASDFYSAYSRLSAVYGMAETPIGANSKLIYGVRVEEYTQNVKGFTIDGQRINQTTIVADVLPSINAKWGITNRLTLRLAYFASVNRPEFREISTSTFYDPTLNATVFGNPGIKRARIQNFDAKLEYYPNEGATISINPFYKKLDSPIEQTRIVASAFPTFSYGNAREADIRGLEVEVRTDFAFIHGAQDETGTRRGIGEDFTLFANGSLIESNVPLNAGRSRPLQGQSPYILNSGLTYRHRPTGIDGTVTVNRTGTRIVYAGDEYESCLWEKPRTVLDASITFRRKQLTLKFILGDLFAQDLNYFILAGPNLNPLNQSRRDFLGTPVYKDGVDVNAFGFTNGRTLRLTASYDF